MRIPTKQKPTADDVRRVALAALTAALEDGKQEAKKKPGLTGVRAVATGAVIYTAGRAAFSGRRFIRDHFGSAGEAREEDGEEMVEDRDEDYEDEEDEEPQAEEDEDYEDEEDEEPQAAADEDYEDEEAEEPQAEEDEDYDDEDEDYEDEPRA